MGNSARVAVSSRRRRLVGWLATRKRDTTYLWRGFALLVWEEPRLAWTVLILGIIRASLPVAQLWLTRAVVNALVDGNRSLALWSGIGLVLSILGDSLLEPLQDVLGAQVQDRGTATVERRLIAAGRDYADLTEIERPGMQDAIFTAGEAATWLSVLINGANQTYGSVLSLAGVLVTLATLHPAIPVLMIATLVVRQLVASRADIGEYTAMRDNATTAREMEYALVLSTRPENAAEVRVFGLSEPFSNRYRRLGAAAIASMRAARLRGMGWIAASRTFGVVIVAGIF